MSVQDIMISLFNVYEPTGIFSFEFRRPTGQQITEIFFLLPPESESVEEPQRSSLTPTLRGGYYTDFGNDFKPIKISGSTHLFYGGSTNNPSKEYGSTENIGVSGYIDGFTEFIKLRYMLIRYRDYTLTKDGKITAPDFAAPEVSRVNTLKRFVQKLVEEGDGALIDEIEVIYHNYDKDDHFKVRVERFTSSSDKSDPWSIRYDISLEAYEVDTQTSGRITISTPQKNKPTTPQIIQNGNLLIGNLHEESRPDTVTVNNPATSYTIPNYSQTQIENPPTTVDLGV